MTGDAVERAVRPIVGRVARSNPTVDPDDLYDVAVSVAVETWARKPDATISFVRSAVLWRLKDWLRVERRTVSTAPAELENTRSTRDHAPDVVNRVYCHQLLEGLPERQRAVLMATYYLDMPDEEIGELLGTKAAAVRHRRFRAEAALWRLAT